MSRYRDPRRPRPPGRPSPARLLAGLIFAGAVAFALAGLVLLWDASPAGSLLIVTPAIQAVLLGLALTFLIARLRIRSMAVALLLGLGAGAASLAIMHVGHYVKFVTADLPRLLREEPLAADQRLHLLLDLHRQDPFGFADRHILRHRTGHAGFPGFMALRNFLGTEVAGRRIWGWSLWAIWGAEGLLVVLVPAVLAVSRASRPFCLECGDWYASRPVESPLPGELAGPLVEAIRGDDPAGAAALRDSGRGEPLDDLAAARAVVCPRCGRGLVDVARVVGEGRRRRVELLLSGHRASPAMVEALALGSETALRA